MDDVVANAHLFWEIVEQTLIELYGLERGVAREKIAARRGKMTRWAIARNLVYHSQPIHIAHDLAAPSDPIPETLLKRYDKIASRLRMIRPVMMSAPEYGNPHNGDPESSTPSSGKVAVGASH